MSEHTLNDQEAAKLFRDAYKAEAASDPSKLADVMTSTSSTEEEEQEQQPSTPAPEAAETEDTSAQDNTDTKETPQETTPADTSGEPNPDDTKTEPDDLTKLRQELEKVKKENHGLKSQAGRVPYMQSRLRDIDKKLKELAEAGSSPSNLPSTKLTPKLQESLKSIEATDPELAKAIIASITTATDAVASDSIARERESLSAQREQYTKEYAQEQLGILLHEYPNAPDVFKSNDWAQWKNEQSEGIQRLAGSMDARDVMTAFDLYRNYLVAKNPELATTTAVAAPVATDPKAAEIEAERLRKKENAAVIRTPATPAKTSVPDDINALFELAYKQERKAAGRD